MPTLYLVGTPIGNLEDISLRALRLLDEVSLIAAEDTRVTGRLLRHYDISTPMVSFHEYSSPERIASLIENIQAVDVALATIGMDKIKSRLDRIGKEMALKITIQDDNIFKAMHRV